ncbi:MAG: thiol reductant ABC exporter subunit CydC [Leptolinea sp.]|jgi:ATP-binding cassette subfamily C protein CydC|nr:thiol reductant ABC exporter subunit CydC [Leptolinea sp.]
MTGMSETSRLLSFARPYGKEIGLSVLLSVATTAASIGLMGTSSFLIATAALQPSIAVLQVAIVGVRTFGIARGVFRYLERLITHSVNLKLLARIRGWFFRSVEPLAPGGLEDLKSGDLLARSIHDIENLEDFYVRGIAPPLAAVLVTLGISLFTAQYAVNLAALLAGGLILTGLVLSLQVRSISRELSSVAVDSHARISALAVETVRGTVEILMANAENRHLDRVREASYQSRSAEQAMSSLHSISLASGVLFSNLTLVGILYLGIPLVRATQFDGVTLAVLTLITLASFEPVNGLPAASTKIQSSLASARRLFEVADRPRPVIEPQEPSEIPEFSRLVISHLTYQYPGTLTPALQDISFTLNSGSKIALVGPSGSGKSTLLKIIQRYLPAPSSSIFWNDMDLNKLSGDAVRNQLAVLSQNGYVFSATLRENLSPAGSNKQDFMEVLKQVGLAEWFSRLPDGMDTWTGDNGSLLSGGERQRLILARTLLLDRPLLLADEPFNHLDLASEQAVLNVLLDSAQSCIVATHRLVGMHRFDHILVLEAGRIIQAGKHTELLGVPGLYRQFWDSQNNRFSFDL